MKHSHTLAAIDAAEMRMEISRRETREGLHRVQRALRERVSRPSTLVAAGGVAGLVGLAGFLLARRPQPRQRRAYAAAGTGVVVASSLAAVARFLMSRYGVRVSRSCCASCAIGGRSATRLQPQRVPTIPRRPRSNAPRSVHFLRM
jgi:hypothetical protein